MHAAGLSAAFFCYFLHTCLPDSAERSMGAAMQLIAGKYCLPRAMKTASVHESLRRGRGIGGQGSLGRIFSENVWVFNEELIRRRQKIP
jgi:hypothetical protein